MCIQDGMTALMIAVEGDDEEITRQLMNSGADLNVRDEACHYFTNIFAYFFRLFLLK